MPFKVHFGEVTIEAGTIDEAEALARRLNGAAPLQSREPSGNGNSLLSEMEEGLRPGRTSGHGVPRPLLIRSTSKREAALKLFRSLKTTSQTSGLRFLATKTEPVDVEELRQAAGLPNTHRMSGFTAGITRRAPAFGLEPHDVLLVESPGVISGVRIYRYSLGPEMRAALSEEVS